MKRYLIMALGGLALLAIQGCTPKKTPPNPNSMSLRLELFTKDVAKTAAFYRDVLGFELEASEYPTYQPVKRGNVLLGIGLLDKLSEAHHFDPGQSEIQFGYGVEIVLEVPDVTEAFEKAVNAGASISETPKDQPWGLRDFRMVDPNGYYIRVTSIH